MACTGVYSHALAASLGERINVYLVKGYSITVEVASEEEVFASWTGFLDDKVKIVASRLGASRLRVAGMAGSNGFNRDIRMSRIEPLVSGAAGGFHS